MKQEALQVLRSIYGHDAVPEPRAYVVSQWAADPYTRGSYSYVAVGASGEDYDLLSRALAKVCGGVWGCVRGVWGTFAACLGVNMVKAFHWGSVD